MAKPSARPVRKQDIHFKQSLFRFTLSFILVCVVGLFTRVFLHNYPLKQKLLEKIEVPARYQLKMDDAAFSFRSGFIPVIAVTVNRFDLQEKDCSLRKLGAQNLMLRVDPWGLLFGELKLGRIDLEYLEVTGTENCDLETEPEEDEINSDAKAGPKNSAKASLQEDPKSTVESGGDGKDKSLLSRLQKSTGKILPKEPVSRLFSDIESIAKTAPFRNLVVEEFQVNYQTKGAAPWSVEGEIRLELKKEWVAVLEVDKIRYASRDLSFLKSRWKALLSPDKIHLRTESSVREGDLLAQVRIENDADLSTHVTGRLRRIPLSAVTSAFLGDVEFSYLWANCEFEANGSWQKILQKKVSLGNCQIDGPYGEIQIKEFESTFNRIEKLDMQVRNVVLDKVFENKRDLALSGVFSSYGILSGQLLYVDGDWRGSGFLENSEFIFSNNNLRDIQKVKKIPFEFSRVKKNTQALIGKMELDGGLFEGEIRINQQQDGQTSGRIAIHKIQLHPRIYKLILNSQPTELRIYGKFNWAPRQLPQWSAMLATEELQSEYYDLKFLKVKGNSQENAEARVKVTISEGVIKPKGPFLDWIEPTYLEANFPEDSIGFTELSTHLTIYDNREVAWNRGYVRLSNGWQLSSEGKRDSSKQVAAWLQWDRPDRKYLRWNYIGSFFNGNWVPETDWVKRWLSENPDFLKDHESVVYASTAKSTLTDKINKAGKKAIERVKEVLQPQTGEGSK